MHKRYYDVTDGVLVSTTSCVEIDRSEYTVVEVARRFTVLQHKDGTTFLIDVGYRDNERTTIMCRRWGELIHALALVRTAFPTKRE